MILQRLVEYYDRLAADPESGDQLAAPGMSVQKVSFCVVLEPDGRLQQFQSLQEQDGKRLVSEAMLLPGQGKPPGSGLNPCFLWDNTAYMLGFKADDDKPERTANAFEAFRDRHLALENEINSPSYSAVCLFLRDWSPEKAKDHAEVLSAFPTGFGVFRIGGERQYVHDNPAVKTYWANQSDASAEGAKGLCLVTGQTLPIATLHEPKIKGVRGAQSSGALLVSFNAKAYESLGREQGNNAPVSESAAFRYANALNSLLSRNDRRLSLGDATIVFWTGKPTQIENFVSDILGDAASPAEDAPAEDKERAMQVKRFFSQLRVGHATDEAISEDEDATPFYALGLSPNASRLSVRFWRESNIGQMKQLLLQHIQDTALDGARDDDPPLMIRKIVNATGRAETDPSGRFKGYDLDAVSPMLAGAIARAVLTGGPYPQSLLQSMVRRIRADGAIRHERVAAIKAVIVRNSRFNGQPKEVPMALDTHRSDSAYVTGRLFALLEKIQSDSAGGDLNATIKDRYFSAASATPGIVFPRLIRLSQFHLAKMEGGQKVFYEKLLGEVIGKLDGFARHLPLEEQGLFAVGYFHQRQDLFTSKKDKQGDSQ